MQVGDSVNLVRKITLELLPVTLVEVLIKSPTPAVVVRWKSDRHRYKLMLVKNEVLGIECTQDHRQSMRSWYSISEEHRKALTELYWETRKRGR